MAFPVTGILDAFTRANENPVTGVFGSGPIRVGNPRLQIVSNGLKSVGVQGQAYTTGTYAANCECGITVTTLPPAASGFSVACRIATPNTANWDGYWYSIATVSGAANDTYQLYRVDNNVFTQLGATVTGPDLATSNKVGIEAIGSAISGYLWQGSSWAQQLTRSDATYTAGGSLGFQINESTTCVLDDAFGGTIPTVRTLTDTGMTFTESLLRIRGRTFTDTGMTFTESLPRKIARTIADTGTVFTEALLRKPGRPLTDTGTTFTESLLRKPARPLTDNAFSAAGVSESAYNAAVLADTPRAFWKMQDASGNPVDSSGNGLDMTSVTGAVAYHDTGPMSDFQIAFDAGESVQRSSPVSTVTDNFTIEAIVNVTNVTANDEGILYVGNPASNGWALVAQANGKFRYLCFTVASGAESAAVIEGAGFKHVVIVRRAGTWEYYVNGALDTANAGTTTPNAPSGGTTGIGDSALTWGASFVAVYESALSAGRIQAHYAAGFGAFESLASSKSTGGTFRTLTDTGMTFSESLPRKIARAVADTGTTFTEALPRSISRPLTDTGTTFTESLLRKPGRPLTDTGMAFTEALPRKITRALTDTGTAFSESLLRAATRPLTDTGTTFSESLVSVAGKSRTLTDTGMVFTEALPRKITRTLTDQGTTFTESLPRTIARPLTDTGTSFSESLASVKGQLRTLSDTGIVGGSGDPFGTQLTVFPGGNENPLSEGGAWAGPVKSGQNQLQLISNGAGTSGVGLAGSYRTATVGADHVVWAEFNAGSFANNDDYRLIVRFTSPNSGAENFYQLNIEQRAAADVWMVYKIVAGAAGVKIADLTSTDVAVGDWIGFSAVGNRLTAYLKPGGSGGTTVEIGHVDDSVIAGTSGDRIGLAMVTGGTRHYIRFGGGTFAGTTDQLARTFTQVRALTDTGMAFSESLTKSKAQSRTLTDTGMAFSESLVKTSSRSWALSDIGIVASVNPFAVQLSTFAGADESPASEGGNWGSKIETTFVDQLAIASHTLKQPGSSTASSVWTPAVGDDQSVWAEIGSPLTDIGYWRLYLRVTNPNTGTVNFYAIALHAIVGSADSWQVVKTVSGSPSSIGFLTATDVAVGDWIGFTAVGNVLTGYIKPGGAGGTLTSLGSFTDSDLTSGKIGLGLNVGASPVANFVRFGGGTISVVTDSLIVSHASSRSLTDTGMAFSEALPRKVARSLTDTGTVFTESLARTIARLLTDTGVTFTESLVKTTSSSRTLSDTGIAFSEALARKPARPLTDTAVTHSDSLHVTALSVHLTDTGVAFSEALARKLARLLTDTGFAFSESLARKPTRLATDTAVTQTDSLHITALSLHLTTTGVTFSESLFAVAGPLRALTDAGMAFSESIKRALSRTIADTGMSFSESLTSSKGRLRALTDTGVAASGTGDPFAVQLTVFPGANENPLSEGGAWAGPVKSTHNQLQLSGNGAAQTGGVFSTSYRTAAVGPDHSVWAEFNSAAFPDFDNYSLIVRLTNPNSGTVDYYQLNVEQRSGADVWQVFEIINGAAGVKIADLTSTDVAPGDWIGFAAVGNVLTAYLKAGGSGGTLTSPGSVTDSSIPGTSGDMIGLGIATGGSRKFVRFGGGAFGVSDSLDWSIGRALADTGMAFSETLTRFTSRALTDTGVTFSETLARKLARPFTDTGVSFAESLLRKPARPLTDTGVSFADSLVTGAGASRTLTDTGTVFSESIKRALARTLTDTGTTISESIKRAISRKLTDQGVTFSDSLVAGAGTFRTLTDTGTVFSESIRRFIARSLTDTGFSFSETLTKSRMHPVALATTGTTFSETLQLTRGSFRTLTDTGVTASDALARPAVTRKLSDQGTTFSESIKRALSRTGTETGVNFSEQLSRAIIVTRPLAATGVTFSDSLAKGRHVDFLDVGVTHTDSLHVTALLLHLTDTGTVFSSALSRNAGRHLLTTGVAASDSLARAIKRGRAITDTAVTFSESTNRKIVRHLADTGVAISTQLRRRIERHPVTTGVTFSESLTRRHHAARALTETGTSFGEQLTRKITRRLTDRAVTQTDSVRITARSKHLADTGVVFSDQLATRRARPDTEAGVNFSESLARNAKFKRALAVSGVVFSDGLRRRTASTLTVTGVAFSELLARKAKFVRLATDEATAFSDQARRSVARRLHDQGVAFTVTLASSRAKTRSLSDVGCAFSETLKSKRARHLTDTGVAFTEALRKRVARALVATGTVFSEQLAVRRSRSRNLTDTGCAFSEHVRPRVARRLTSTAVVFSDSLAAERHEARAVADQGVSFSEALGRRLHAARAVTDTGATVTDQAASRRTRKLADQGVVFSEQLALRIVVTRRLTDKGTVLFSDTLVAELAGVREQLLLELVGVPTRIVLQGGSPSVAGIARATRVVLAAPGITLELVEPIP